MNDKEFEEWVKRVSSGNTEAKPPGVPLRRAVQHEAMEQEALFSWAAVCSAAYPELEMMYHIPNGGKRNRAEAVHLKRQGVKSGVPDICLPVPRNGFHGLYIELKAGDNKPTKNQSEWLLRLKKQGYATAVCVGWIEAKETISKYLGMRGTNT